jgi:hypothetical protein
MDKKTTIQKFNRKENTLFDVAKRYYSILSAINDLNLTKREIQLVAFTAIKGNISYSSIRDEFCKLHKSSSPTINNIISKLKKKQIFVKDASKIKVNPLILLPFENNLIIQTKVELNG